MASTNLALSVSCENFRHEANIQGLQAHREGFCAFSLNHAIHHMVVMLEEIQEALEICQDLLITYFELILIWLPWLLRLGLFGKLGALLLDFGTRRKQFLL